MTYDVPTYVIYKLVFIPKQYNKANAYMHGNPFSYHKLCLLSITSCELFSTSLVLLNLEWSEKFGKEREKIKKI